MSGIFCSKSEFPLYLYGMFASGSGAAKIYTRITTEQAYWMRVVMSDKEAKNDAVKLAGGGLWLVGMWLMTWKA